MGRWIGIARVVRLLLGAVMALVAGLIWDGIGPAWVFVAYVAIELAIRVPLLATMGDTLGIAHPSRGSPAASLIRATRPGISGAGPRPAGASAQEPRRDPRRGCAAPPPGTAR